MTDSFLFDAGSILLLVRELGERAPDILLKSSTIPLAYYEVGNAVWKECFLLKRLDVEKAVRLLTSVFTIMGEMDVMGFGDEKFGVAVLDAAGRLNVTYYDASYLVAAQKHNRILVTDDERLRTTAEKMGLKATKSKTLH
mgnify:FL=1